jgi:hypothetical protein
MMAVLDLIDEGAKLAADFLCYPFAAETRADCKIPGANCSRVFG